MKEIKCIVCDQEIKGGESSFMVHNRIDHGFFQNTRERIFSFKLDNEWLNININLINNTTKISVDSYTSNIVQPKLDRVLTDKEVLKYYDLARKGMAFW